MNLGELTKSWQTFYAMLGGATATLMGLLFVSLSLHFERIHDAQNSHFLRLARLTFSNYLMLLVFSLQMLIPMMVRVQLSIPMAGIGLVGLFWSFYLRNKDLDKADQHRAFLVRSSRMSLIAYFLFVGLAYFSQVEPATALYFTLTPVLMLVVISVRNSWGLMMMLRAKRE